MKWGLISGQLPYQSKNPLVLKAYKIQLLLLESIIPKIFFGVFISVKDQTFLLLDCGLHIFI